MLYSTRITAEGMIHQPWAEYVQESIVFYARALPQSLGWPLLLLVFAGLGIWGLTGLRQKGLSPLISALLGMLVGVACVCVLIPAGYSTRYLLPALAPLLIAAVFCGSILESESATFFISALGCNLGRSFCLHSSMAAKKRAGFFAGGAAFGPACDGRDFDSLAGRFRSSWGGAIIASAAFSLAQRSPSSLQVLRGSKELAKSDWMGRGYTADFTDDATLLNKMDELKVQRVFLDLSVPESLRTAHEKSLERALPNQPERWQLDFEQPVTRLLGETGSLRVYRRL